MTDPTSDRVVRTLLRLEIVRRIAAACIPSGILLATLPIAAAQEIEVALTQRTITDDHTVHIEALVPHPAEDLTLPNVDTSGAAFLEIFYSWDADGNEIVSAMVLPGEDGQTFYIDLNNDEDLTNDGEPLSFPYDENELVFYFGSSSHPEQRTGRALQRRPRWALENPEMGETFLRRILDEDGNLQPSARSIWMEHNPGMTGRKHTFFFDERVEVARGEFRLDGVTRGIGLFDYNQDGRFDGVEHPQKSEFSDLLMIDENGDGRLTGTFPNEFYKLNDVFPIGTKRYRLSYIDAYGRSLRLEETEQALTQYYVTEREARAEVAGAHIQASGEIGEDFWDLELTTTAGDVLRMADLKNRYVLLNFWGEWCAPCIAELPALLEARANHTESKLAIVGMLKTEDLAAAMNLVNERGMSWPQVRVEAELEERFKARGYPTNLLILPDGEHYLRAGGVSALFFEKYVK